MSPTGIFVFLACAHLCGVLALQHEKGLEPTQFNGSQTSLGEVPTGSGYSAENDTVEDEVGGDVGSGLPSSQQQQCPCGDNGLEWEKIVHLNLSDPAQACPMGLNLTAHPVRGCGRSSLGSGCDSIWFSVHNHTYTRVCGQVQAYQKGSSHAFFNALQLDQSTVEEAYVSGISLTYGKPSSRSAVLVCSPRKGTHNLSSFALAPTRTGSGATTSLRSLVTTTSATPGSVVSQ